MRRNRRSSPWRNRLNSRDTDSRSEALDLSNEKECFRRRALSNNPSLSPDNLNVRAHRPELNMTPEDGNVYSECRPQSVSRVNP